MKATITLALFLMAAPVGFAKPAHAIPIQQTALPAISVKAAVFGSFQVHRKQNGAALAWTVNAPGITEYIIERSYDGSRFEVLDHVPPADRSRQQYQDDTVLPGFIYYRVKAVLADGSVDESETAMVRIVRHA